MAGHWETFEHTADVGLAGRGDTLGELLEALGEGLAELLCRRASVRPAERHTLTVEADDVESITVDFLARLLTWTQVERFCVHAVRVTSASPTRVEAVITGEPTDPARHELGDEVKAVTYHMLEVRHDGNVWHGRVLLDL